MKYRNKTDILAEILESAVTDSVTKTKIMYTAFVPHEQLKDFLGLLTRNDLLVFNPETTLYQTTEKGFRFLHAYKIIRELAKKTHFLQHSIALSLML